MFEKKFKVKVVHYSGEYYVVKYAYYRFTPIYHNICDWFEYRVTSNLESWSSKLFNSTDKAEEFAHTFKTYEDVIEYYKPLEKMEKDFYKRKEEYYNSIKSYGEKQIL